jgi:hypothetical protein
MVHAIILMAVLVVVVVATTEVVEHLQETVVEVEVEVVPLGQETALTLLSFQQHNQEMV